MDRCNSKRGVEMSEMVSTAQLKHQWTLAIARRRFLVPAALCLAAVMCLPWDVQIAAWINSISVPGDLKKLLDLSEVYAHGYGVLAITITIAALDDRARHCLIHVIAAAFGSGLTADLLKVLVVARVRPRGLTAGHGLSSLDTFSQWLPLLSVDSDLQSFPSAHTATACGLTVVLIRLYPRGWWLFSAFAVLAALQRILSSAHFVSDVLVGAAVGSVVGLWVSSHRRFPAG